MPLKILTFNHHEPYLHLLAKTSHEFHVVERKGTLDLSWNKHKRPVPQNVTLITWDEALREKIESGFYDVVVAHTIKTLIWLFPFFRIPMVFVIHVSMRDHTFFQRIKSLVKRSFLKFFTWTHRCEVVAISDLKRRSWNVKAHVIEPCLDSSFLSKLSSKALTHNLSSPLFSLIYVCNHLLERKEELGYDIVQDIHKHIPLQVIGHNPGLSFSITPKNYEEFLQLFSRGKIYLYTTRQPFNDGYNLAMLEAMSLGLPVVTIDNPSSPIVHGHNGLIGKNVEEMVEHIRYLLEHPEELTRMGHEAQKTVRKDFSEERFLTQWNVVLSRASAGHIPRSTQH